MLLRTFKTLSSLRVSLRPNTAITAVLRNTFSSMENFDGEFRTEQEPGHSYSRHSKYADKRENRPRRQDSEKEFDAERFHDQEGVDIKTEKIQLTRESPATENVNEANKLENFDISIQMIEHLETLGITSLFPIQAAMFQHAMDGKDLIARDKTGSGKTLSYALPLCEKFRGEGLFKKARKQKPLGLVILPTRELVIQVTNVFNTIKLNEDFRVLSVYGGTDIRSQIHDAEAGCEFIVGTPGRLIDLIKREAVDLSELKTVVLDEADRMLDMGFQEDIEKIYEHIKGDLGTEVQTMLFSATIPDWVVKVAKQYLKEDTITVDLLKGTEWKMPQTVQNLAIKCPYKSRYDAIGDLVLCYGGKHARTIIFTETKKEANDVMMEANIKQECQVLHGDIPQNQREITFRAFREGKFKCLIATDVAARGLDIPEVDLVVQLSPPRDVDTYIHRAGRTARAGRNGVCVTFYSNEQMDMLNLIQKEAKFKFKMIGAPQPEDIIKASSRDIAASIKNVPHDVVGMFKEAADELIQDLGAEEALCRALAIVTGTNQKLKQRSLLSSIEGYITYVVETPREIVLTKVWHFLKGNLDREVTESIKGMKLFKDQNGAAFDVPAEFEEEFLRVIENNPNEENFLLKKATSLPELVTESREFIRGFKNDRMDNRQGNRRNSFERDDRDRRPRDRSFREDRDNRDNRRDSSRGNRDRDVGRRQDREFTEEDRRKIFVAGLPYEAVEEDVKNFFDENDLITQKVYLLKDVDGNSRGTGFVVFEDPEDAKRAMNLSGSKLMKRSIRIDQVNPR